MARAFLMGAVSTIPAVIFEVLLSHPGEGATWLECFLVIGPAEEISKFFATLWSVRREPDFDEPSDGIVAAAAAALGFAFAENIGYFAGGGAGRVVIRTVLSVPGHVLFAVSYGAALGRWRTIPGHGLGGVAGALILASALHGLFDALLFNVADSPVLYMAAFITLVYVMWALYRRTARACAAEGRAMHAQGEVGVPSPDLVLEAGDVAAAAPGAAPPGPDLLNASATAREPFRWVTAMGAMGWGVLFVILTMAGLEAVHLKSDGHVAAAVILALLAAGAWSAYRSPGYTVRESAVGLGLLGMLLGGGPVGAVIIGFLGAFGGWLGESLQDASGRK